MTALPKFYRCHNGPKGPLPFTEAEYQARQRQLRHNMAEAGVAVAVFTTMQNIDYYSGFLYCLFGRPYGLVVTSNMTS